MKKDVEKLEELGIKDDGKKRQTCPNCRDTRSNKTDKSLSINWKLCTAYCYHCDAKYFFGKTDKSDKEETATRKKEETKEYKKPGRLANEEAPGEEVLKWFESRGIPADVVVEEGITQAVRHFYSYLKQNMMKKKKREGLEAFRNGPAQQSPLCDSTPR